jgi:hypothetical protein
MGLSHFSWGPPMKGYQFLENDFFELCKTRNVRPMPMLLYIYLRGLYCRFQKPIFFWTDKTTRDHLGITQNTLSSARLDLQERGLLKFKSGIGRTPSEYTMLGSILLPGLSISKIAAQSRRFQVRKSIKNYDTYNTIKERLKNRTDLEIFRGISDEDRALLKNKGLYD